MNLTLGKSISYLRQSAFYVQHAACLSGAGYPSRWDCLLSSSLFIPMKRSPLQRNFPGLTCQRKPPPPNIWWFQGGARSRGWYLAPAAISPHPSPGFGGRFGMDGCAQIATSLLLGLGCGLGGSFFRSRFLGYALTFVIVHSPFIAAEGHFFTAAFGHIRSRKRRGRQREARLLLGGHPALQRGGILVSPSSLNSASPLRRVGLPVSPGRPPSRLSAIAASAPCFLPPEEDIRGQRELQDQIQSRAHFGAPLVG